jgi:hypothetical protein
MHVTAENARSVWQETERWTRTTRPVSSAAVSGERGANPATTSFTPVHHEADRLFPRKIPAWQTPFFALR